MEGDGVRSVMSKAAVTACPPHILLSKHSETGPAENSSVLLLSGFWGLNELTWVVLIWCLLVFSQLEARAGA